MYRVALLLRQLAKEKTATISLSAADSVLTGASAALFLGSSQRVSTVDDVTLSFPGCLAGLCPDCGVLDLLTSGAVVPPSFGLVVLLSGGQFSTASFDEVAPNCATAADSGQATLEAVERVVSGTHGLRYDAAARIDAIQEGLAAEAEIATDAEAGLWLAEHSSALGRGCPAAQIVTYVASRRASLDRQGRARRQRPGRGSGDGEDRGEDEITLVRRSLGMELAANTVLSTRADFLEGASCMIGLRQGNPPVWQHASRHEAAKDPEVVELVRCVLGAPIFPFDDPLAAFMGGAVEPEEQGKEAVVLRPRPAHPAGTVGAD